MTTGYTKKSFFLNKELRYLEKKIGMNGGRVRVSGIRKMAQEVMNAPLEGKGRRKHGEGDDTVEGR